MTPNKRVIITGIAAIALTLSACSGSDSASSNGASGAGSAGEATPSGNGEIHLGVAYETTNYHPSQTSSALALGANWHVVEGLYEFNMDDYTVYPALAAGEPNWSSDTEFEVDLRDDAKFSDGTEVTSQDVISSYERSMAEGNLYASMLNFIDTIEAVDEDTVKFTLNQPFSIATNRLVVAKIVPASATDDELTAMPIGSGPYKYESITDSKLEAVPNEHYNGPNKAGADKIVWDVIKDDTARTTAATSGTIDVMEAVPAASAPMLESAGMTVAEVKGFNLPFLLFNTTKAPFDDPRVRQAFLYAVNTDMLIQNNMDGKATAATSFLPESNPAYNKAKNVFTYDPEKAKSLLEEAGVTDLNITLLTTDHPWISDLAPQIQNDLQAAGIKVSLQSEASASLYANNLDVDNPTFDVALAPGDPSVFGNDPALLMNWWYGDNVWTKKRTFWQQSDPETWQELQDIINEGAAAEGAEQQEKWNEAFDLISEEVPLYPLFHRTMLTGYNPNTVADFKPIGTTGLWAVTARSNR
ncbi:ABC transporter substrate-binding protein [Corynebacterium aquatimens]|uniref:ABC transporter substrate-binding protein n=1 Tax=Corynebacterium TaxID=1716 RepID=UPI001F483E0D|nr:MULTISPECIES: ABC transporter substrate-binding protein [Corynebacterium]QYH19618.1 ABC transporter substrate-binding protein [Corynebacterium aquatimens]UIZ91401.1 ABC transporter substrate-binding protein [Corynebacterium sp. CNCTC7651]